MSVKNKIEDLNDYFKLPIYYNKNKTSIKKNIITDLELIKTYDANDANDTNDANDKTNKSIYSYYFNNNNNSVKNPLLDNIIQQVSQYYTTDTDFIKDNQKLLKSFTHMNHNIMDTINTINTINTIKLFKHGMKLKGTQGLKRDIIILIGLCGNF